MWLHGFYSVFAAVAQTKPAGDVNAITVKPYWDGFREHVFVSAAEHGLLPSYHKTMEDLRKAACGDYQDSTHCERTLWDSIQHSTADADFIKLKASNGLVYTINTTGCKTWDAKKNTASNKKCKKVPNDLSGVSYDAVADENWLYINFETPTNQNIVEAFRIFDVAALKPTSDSAAQK